MRSERGAGTVEYIGIVLVVAVLFVSLTTAIGWRVPGGELARAIAGKLICAVGGEGRCELPQSETVAAYGPDLSALVGEHAPSILFEDEDVISLPVDFRDCRELTCSDAVKTRALASSHTGDPTTAFVHVIDCREGAEESEYRCDGERAGNLYLQYWLYYPDSATKPFGRKGYHIDDWESYQVKIGSDGTTSARASAHSGHNSDGWFGQRWKNEVGKVPLPRIGGASKPPPIDVRGSGWGPATGSMWVSAGSHAGRTIERPYGARRRIPSRNLRLVPLETLRESERSVPFAVAPPWLKDLWLDPEEAGTG